MSGEVSGRRWRPRFSLRTFLVLFTLLSLWLGWRVYSVSQADRAVQALEQAGGTLYYPAPSSSRLLKVTRRYGGSVFARVLFGNRKDDLPSAADFSHRLLERGLAEGSERVTTDDAFVKTIIPLLSRTPSIERLDLSHSGISGSSCRALAELPQLRWLVLQGTALNDDDLDSISELTQIEMLFLEGTQLSRIGIEALQKRLPRCRVSSAF